MYWPLLDIYTGNLDLGWGFFMIKRTFDKRMKGLLLAISLTD